MKHTVKEVMLDNGAKGLVINAPGVEVVRMLVEFRAGFNLGDWQKYELPHVMEHMMFTNKTYPKPRQFSREVEKNGAFHNAATTDTSLEYEYECATFEAERIAKLIGIQVTEPTFPAAELKNELGNVAEELSSDISSPAATVGNNLHAAAVGAPQLQQRSEQLSSMTDSDLREWFEYTHAAGNMRFIVAGDIDFETSVLPHLNVNLPKGDRLRMPRIMADKLDEPLVERRDIPQMYYRWFSQYNTPLSYRELIAARIIANVLTNGFSSTLLGEARERGLAYWLGMGVGRDQYTSGWKFGGPVSPNHADEYFQLAAEEIKKAQDGDITEEQFNGTKRLMRGERAREYQKVGSLVGYYDMYFNEDEYEEFDECNRLLDEIGVDEAVTAFNKLFSNDTWGVSFVGNVDEKSAQKYKKTLSSLWEST